MFFLNEKWSAPFKFFNPINSSLNDVPTPFVVINTCHDTETSAHFMTNILQNEI